MKENESSQRAHVGNLHQTAPSNPLALVPLVHLPVVPPCGVLIITFCNRKRKETQGWRKGLVRRGERKNYLRETQNPSYKDIFLLFLAKEDTTIWRELSICESSFFHFFGFYFSPPSC